MSKRRKAGDVVLKKENAGFVGERLVIRLLENESDDPCLLECGDAACVEWANSEVLMDGEIEGNVYHVSECELEDG